MEMNSKVTSQFIETVNGIETIKAFNKEENEKEKTDKMYRKFLKRYLMEGYYLLVNKLLLCLLLL